MCPENWNSICYSFNSAFLLHTGRTERTMRQCFQVQSELLTVFQRLWHLEYSFGIFSWYIELCCLIQCETTLCSKTFPKSFLLQVAASAVFSCAVSSPSGPVGYRLESPMSTLWLSLLRSLISQKYIQPSKSCSAFLTWFWIFWWAGKPSIIHWTPEVFRTQTVSLSVI